jgi:hypothetical protein
MTCPSLVNLGTISQNYGQMTGVLAGFAFTALVLLLTPTQSDQRVATGRRSEGVSLAFFVAFITLVIATLVFSVLAGEPEDARPRAATAELIDGVIFGSAALILLHGLSLLMRNASIEASAVLIARIVTVVIVPALAMYFITQGASDTVAAHNVVAGQGCLAIAPVLGAWLTASIAVILSLSFLPAVQRMGARHTSAFRVAAPLTVFVSTIAGAVISGNVSTRSPTFLMSPFVLKLFLVGACLLFLALGLMIAFSDPAEPRTLDDRVRNESPPNPDAELANPDAELAPPSLPAPR